MMAKGGWVPWRSSAVRMSRVAASSTSYQRGRVTASRFAAFVAAMVSTKTVEVLQVMLAKGSGWARLRPMR